MKDQCGEVPGDPEVGESGTPWSPVSSGPQHLTGVALRGSGGEFNASSAAFQLWLLGEGDCPLPALPGSPSGVEG